MNEEQKLKKLESLLALVDESLTKEDFVKSFENVVAFVKKIEQKMETDVSKVKDTLVTLGERLKNETRVDVAEMREEVRMTIALEVQKMNADYALKMAQILEKIESVRDGKDADEEKIVETVLSRVPPPPVIPPPLIGEDFRNALEALPEGEKLVIDAIQDLPTKLNALEQSVEKKTSAVISGGMTLMKADARYTKFHGGGSNLTVSATPPTDPELYDLWIEIP